MSNPDNHSICGGDFNSIWDADEHRGPAAPAPHLIGIPEWTVEILPIRSTASIYHNLQTVPKSITFSTIVPPFGISLYYAVGTDGLWIGLSDHRPMLVVHLQNTPWIKIKHFAPQLHKFMSSLPPPADIRSPTNQHLRRRRNVSRLISRRKRKEKKRPSAQRKKCKKWNRFKKHCSPALPFRLCSTPCVRSAFNVTSVS